MGNGKSTGAVNNTESQKDKSNSSKTPKKNIFRSPSMKSGGKTKREKEIKAIFNNYAEQLNNEKFAKEFISKLPAKDAKEISHAEQHLSTNLYHYLIKHINSDKYNKFIDYVNEKQSSIPNITVSENSIHESQGLQGHYGDTTASKDNSKSEKSRNVSQSVTLNKDDTMCKDGTCENMIADSPTKEGFPEDKCVDAMEVDQENEEPPSPLDISKEDNNKKNGDEDRKKENLSKGNTTKADLETGKQSISNENYVELDMLSPLNPIKEENDDHDNSQPINETESHQDEPNLLQMSTECYSPTTSSLQSCEITGREHEINTLYNKYAEQLNNEEFVKEFISTLSVKDADKLLHGKYILSKELFDFLISTNTEIYAKFIHCMSEKKSSILEDIPYIDANIIDDKDIQHLSEDEPAPDKIREYESSEAVSESVPRNDVECFHDGMSKSMMDATSPKQGFHEAMELDEEIKETHALLECSKKYNGTKDSNGNRGKDDQDVENTMEVDLETEQQSTSIVNESKPDTLSRNFMLISENVDIEKVWPYVYKHFISEPQTSDMEMKDLLKAVTIQPDSPLYVDFREALLQTYPDFYHQIYNCDSPTCSISAVWDPVKEDNVENNNSEVNNKAEGHQNKTNLSKTSTQSSSRTASSLKSGELKNREHQIEMLYNNFREELNDDKFVMGFISKLSAEDADMILHGKSPPSTELFHFLKRQINTNIYNKYINYLNLAKPNMHEDMSIRPTDPRLYDSRGRKRQYEDASMTVNRRESEGSKAVSDSQSNICCDGTVTIKENDIELEHRAYPNTMDGSSLKRVCQEHKCREPILSDMEYVEPHVQLAFSRNDTMAHVIQSIQDQVKGSLVSFALCDKNVIYEDAFHLGRLLTQHNGLEHLSIENNFMGIESISAMIESITDMHRLESISLCGQRLVPPCFEYLRASLQNNSVLQELTLDNCRIDSQGLNVISSVFDKESLKILSLNDNGFGDASLGNLMNSLNNAKNLHRLSLDWNGISDAGCRIVGQRLAQIDVAFSLSLEGNHISDNGAVSLADILKQRSKTCALNLANNQIGNDGAECLVKAWAKKEFSGMLDLKGNQISREISTGNACVMLFDNKTGEERTDIIARRIRNGELFNVIALNDISLEDDSMKTITTALYLQQISRSSITNNCQDVMAQDGEMLDGEELTKVVNCPFWCGIVHLNVSNNALTSKAMDQLVDLIGIDNLQSLNIGGNNFKSTDFYTLSEAMHGNKSLKELHLQNSKMTDQGALYISMAMKYCTSLKHVNLGENEITGDGSAHISNALKVTTSLSMVDINDNHIGEDSGCESGVPHLVAALKESDTLQHLNLRGNKICDAGLKQLSEALPSSSLQSLDVSNNEIGPGGAMPFLSATAESNLGELDMSDNPIAVSFAKTMHQFGSYLKKFGRKLKIVHLRNTKITDMAAKNLMKGKKSMFTLDIASNDISDNLKEEFKKKHGDKVLFENDEW